jgi:N utilization substance protein B
MLRRSRAREVVLQLLYQDDLNPERELAPDVDFMNQRLHRDEELIGFAQTLLNGVRRNRGELNEALEQHAANWSLARMAVTDRNILRLGAFEILYSDTPGRVAINEAVELAKRFGAKQSAQFVNGILDGLLPEDAKSDSDQAE